MNHTVGQTLSSIDPVGLKLMIKFKCKDFLLKECEFEAKGAHSVDEMMKLVEVHARDEHRTLRLSPETIEKIRTSLEKQTRP
ncbi:MAG: hypothetical protein DMG73_19985 [Acidobacteria bacterium]|nr:MAG: hypothetical protein DMG73_19985 [Acidobacteriota bacterium]